MKGVSIYTDGTGGPKKTSPERPPRSGWGMVVLKNGHPTYEACSPIEPQVTTSASELEGIIRALHFIHETPPRFSPVTIWTDSQYAAGVVAGAAQIHEEGYKNSKGKPMANADRIRLIHDFLFPLGEASNVLIRWLPGHSGNYGNEKADYLSKQAAYKGYQCANSLARA